ncbi:MAG: class I SAM-dependent RNA methyltransferase [Lachnospiraceae bacterium]|nr:class I SAM-dependent RNA methyltransferase [Lachnospiraceae bacterium]
MEFVAPCHFGLEAVIRRELQGLGFSVTGTQDGRVSFAADNGPEGLVRANIHLRSAERVLLLVGRFHAVTWDELFEGIKALPWEEILPTDARFWVTKAVSVRSRLFSPSDIQRIVKKAMVERMKARSGSQVFPETGADYPLRVFLLNDEVSVCLDTTGESLHKRGYRKSNVAAPIAENLAAALLMLTPWRPDRILVDPFCGSGTFVIEAAMMAANIAPGIHRHFTAEQWENLVPPAVWKEARREAYASIDTGVQPDLQGYDIDPQAIEVAKISAREAGVEELVHLQVRDVADLHHRKKYGFILTNPPYGERLGAEDQAALTALYRTLGERYASLADWSMYVITSFPEAERAIGRKADRNRKLYNGMIETRFYQYFGAKPPRRMHASEEGSRE